MDKIPVPMFMKITDPYKDLRVIDYFKPPATQTDRRIKAGKGKKKGVKCYNDKKGNKQKWNNR